MIIKDKVCIVGGLRKWYEPLADELGFELVHCCGSNPERILGDLRRSKAMFLMTEAVSHKATIMCVQCAKEHGIPFKRFKGSKSQLRQFINEIK